VIAPGVVLRPTMEFAVNQSAPSGPVVMLEGRCEAMLVAQYDSPPIV
jgi:hypothetical protein